MFPHENPERAVCSAALAMVVAASGCTSWIEIQPRELPKLNPAYNRAAGAAPVYTSSGGFGVAAVREVSVIKVLKPDGSVAKIEGDYDARVTQPGDRVHEFSAPVLAAIDPDAVNLTVRGEEQPPRTFSLNGVRSVEVSQPDMLGTIAWIVGATTVAAVLLAVVAIDANSPD